MTARPDEAERPDTGLPADERAPGSPAPAAGELAEESIPAPTEPVPGPTRADDAEAPANEGGGPSVPAAEDFRDRWLRAEAELQNLRRRAAREREEAWRAAEEGVLIELIAVLDDLERALDAAREGGAAGAWTEGVRLTANGILERLGRYGVVQVDPVGRPFDPHLHEALLEIDAPPGAAPGQVVQVVHRGYARGDRALRAARVVVARAPAGEEA
jgi:molecular chaperone GrpE